MDLCVALSLFTRGFAFDSSIHRRVTENLGLFIVVPFNDVLSVTPNVIKPRISWQQYWACEAESLIVSLLYVSNFKQCVSVYAWKKSWLLQRE